MRDALENLLKEIETKFRESTIYKDMYDDEGTQIALVSDYASNVNDAFDYGVDAGQVMYAEEIFIKLSEILKR